MAISTPNRSSHQIHFKRYILCRIRRRRKGGTVPGLRARTGQRVCQDQDRGPEFANQGANSYLSDLPHTKIQMLIETPFCQLLK